MNISKFFYLVGLFIVFCTPAHAEIWGVNKNKETQIFNKCYTQTPGNVLAETCDHIESCINRENSSAKNMSICTMLTYELWDEKLNFEYNGLRDALKETYAETRTNAHQFVSYNDAIQSLRDAQRLWIKYRDSECQGRYKRLENKGINNIVLNSCLSKLTANRTQYFRLEKERVLSLNDLTRIHIDPTCFSNDIAFNNKPDQITTFRKVSKKKTDYDWSGYLNPAAAEQDFEMHIISSYHGQGKVRVGKTDKPVVLILLSYDSPSWHIEQLQGTEIAKVITFGAQGRAGPLEITGVNENILLNCPLNQISYMGEALKVNGNTRYMPDRFLNDIMKIQSLTGLTETTYQHTYVAGGEFSIPPDLSAVDIQTDVNKAYQPTPLVEMNSEDTLVKYKNLRSEFPSEAQSTLDVLFKSMEVGSLPVLHIERNTSLAGTKHPLDLQPLLSDKKLITIQKKGRVMCPHNFSRAERTKILATLIGSNKADGISCAFIQSLQIGGDGADILEGGFTGNIFNPGPGKDAIDGVHGRTIVVLEKGWGEDSVEAACSTDSIKGTVDDDNRARLSWPSKFYNYIVFGPDIDPSKLRRESEKVIIYPPSQDKLTLNSPCFAFAFADNLSPFETYLDIPLLEKN